MSASIFDREVNTDIQCKKCSQWFPDDLALDAHYKDTALFSQRTKCTPEQEIKWNNTHSVYVDDR